MSLARSVLLRASRSRWLAHELPRRAFMRRASRRFMPGEEVSAALDAAKELARAGIGTLITRLGENVATRQQAELERDHYLEVLDEIRQRALPVQLSVKLTHLGLDLDRDSCLKDLLTLADHSAQIGSSVWIDMEESRYTDVTLDVFRRARATRSNIGLCLQAYLRRTAADLRSLLPLAPAIRLVKGAYHEPASSAFPRKRDVDENFFALGALLLDRATHGQALPVFGTHDLPLIARLRERANAIGIAATAYEFHLLYGIRSAEQRTLAAEGVTMRVLVSYGTEWFPWYMRRLAERPANVWFVVRNLV